MKLLLLLMTCSLTICSSRVTDRYAYGIQKEVESNSGMTGENVERMDFVPLATIDAYEVIGEFTNKGSERVKDDGNGRPEVPIGIRPADEMIPMNSRDNIDARLKDERKRSNRPSKSKESEVQRSGTVEDTDGWNKNGGGGVTDQYSKTLTSGDDAVARNAHGGFDAMFVARPGLGVVQMDGGALQERRSDAVSGVMALQAVDMNNVGRLQEDNFQGNMYVQRSVVKQKRDVEAVALTTSKSTTNNTTKGATKNTTKSATNNTMNSTKNTIKSTTKSATNNTTQSATMNSTKNTIKSTRKSATNNTTKSATNNTTKNATRNTIKSTTNNTTKSATLSATNHTKNSTKNTIKSTTNNTTKSAIKNTTKSTTKNATRNNIKSTTNNTTKSATLSATNNTKNSTKNTIKSTTKNTTLNATNNITQIATNNTTKSATINTTRSTTKSTTKLSSFSGEDNFPNSSDKDSVDNGRWWPKKHALGSTVFVSIVTIIVFLITIVVAIINGTLKKQIAKTCVFCIAFSLLISATGNLMQSIKQLMHSSFDENELFYEVSLTMYYIGQLSAHFWSNALAFKIWQLIQLWMNNLKNGRMTKCKYIITLLQYSVYGWGFPMMLMVASVAKVAIGESRVHVRCNGSSGPECIQLDQQLLLYTYDIPVIFILLMNMLTFGLSARSKRSERLRGKQTTGKQTAMLKYVCISGLISSCWLSEFLSRVTTYHIFLYLFDLFTVLTASYLFWILAYQYVKKTELVQKMLTCIGKLSH